MWHVDLRKRLLLTCRITTSSRPNHGEYLQIRNYHNPKYIMEAWQVITNVNGVKTKGRTCVFFSLKFLVEETQGHEVRFHPCTRVRTVIMVTSPKNQKSSDSNFNEQRQRNPMVSWILPIKKQGFTMIYDSLLDLPLNICDILFAIENKNQPGSMAWLFGPSQWLSISGEANEKQCLSSRWPTPGGSGWCIWWWWLTYLMIFRFVKGCQR